MIFKTFPMDRGTRTPHSGQPVHVPLPQSLSRPLYSHNLHTSGISKADNFGSLAHNLQGSTNCNPRHSVCNTISFVPLPVVVVGDKFKAHVSALNLHELGNMMGNLLLRLFPGFCLNKGLHNITTHHNYIKPPTNPPTTRSPA